MVAPRHRHGHTATSSFTRHTNRTINMFEDHMRFQSRHCAVRYTGLAYLGDLNQKAVLDFGCGAGFFLEIAAKGGASRVVGIDVSHDMLLHAAANLHNSIDCTPCFLEADCFRKVETTVCESESFDCVTASTFLINYAPNYKCLENLFANMYDFTKQGGRIFISAMRMQPEGEYKGTPLLGSLTTKLQTNENLDKGCEKAVVQVYEPSSFGVWDPEFKFKPWFSYPSASIWDDETIIMAMQNAGFKNARALSLQIPPEWSNNNTLCRAVLTGQMDVQIFGADK